MGPVDWGSLLSTLGYDALGLVWGLDLGQLRDLPEEELRSILSYTLRLNAESDLGRSVAEWQWMAGPERLERLRLASSAVG